MAKKILIVDDEVKIVELVKAYLEKAGFKTVAAYDGEQALELFRRESPALVLLDLMLPRIDGLDVARMIRKDSNVPIIMLTARAEEADRVAGLELGADDYVVKPFSPRELVARVRAVLRRSEEKQVQKIIRIKDLIIDLENHQVQIKGKQLELTRTEFTLLKVLASNPGRVFSRLQLIGELEGTTYAVFERTVDTHIKNLRKKIEPDPKNPSYILTVHGVGYKFQQD